MITCTITSLLGSKLKLTTSKDSNKMFASYVINPWRSNLAVWEAALLFKFAWVVFIEFLLGFLKSLSCIQDIWREPINSLSVILDLMFFLMYLTLQIHLLWLERHCWTDREKLWMTKYILNLKTMLDYIITQDQQSLINSNSKSLYSCFRFSLLFCMEAKVNCRS